MEFLSTETGGASMLPPGVTPITELKQQITGLVHVALSGSRLTYASIGVGLVFAFLLFKIMFRESGTFAQDVENSRRYSVFHAEYWKRTFDGNQVERDWSKLKIFVWLALSVVGGWASHHKLPELFPAFFQ